MAEKIILDKIPEEYMVKSLGKGASAECFLTSEGHAFKKFNSTKDIDSFYNIFASKEYYKSDIFVFPHTFVFLGKEEPVNFVGYLMKYIDGVKLQDLESNILIRDLMSAIRQIEIEMKRLTLQGLMFNDLNSRNILFQTIHTPRVVDTDLYEGTYNDMFGDMFKENIKELAETIICSVVGYDELESEKMNRYIYQCGCYGMMLPSLLMSELLDYAESTLGIKIETYGDYKNSMKLLRKH
ncbi:MAG: hypothetical protein MR938_01040 [Tenericutes bacterium]|nr:hypothetical protein [Mycoplasmatota bacterium]